MWQEEKELINALKFGEEKAYQLLVDVYSRRIYNLCLRLVPSQQDAEDTTQEIFTTIYLSIASFRTESSLSTWIYRIAINKCREFNRRKSRKKRFGMMYSWEETHEEFHASSIQNPEKSLLNSELGQIMLFSIENLPENQRIAFTLSKLEGMKNEIISNTMDISISAVESLLFRAKKSVIRQMNNYLKND